MTTIIRSLITRNILNGILGRILLITGGVIAVYNGREIIDALQTGVANNNIWSSVVLYCAFGLGLFAIGATLLKTLSRAVDRVDWLLVNVAPLQQSLRITAILNPSASGEDEITYFAELMDPDRQDDQKRLVYRLKSAPVGGTIIDPVLADVYFDPTPRGIALILTNREYLVGTPVNPKTMGLDEFAG